jgi:isoleucyl-tRNA synthetase
LAPILSFTSDEIWQSMPGERSDSVFLEQWYQELTPLNSSDSFNSDYWHLIITLREAVAKAMESFRAAGNSTLDADVILYCDGDLKRALEQLNDELRFVLITSDAKVSPLADKPDDILLDDELGVAIQVNASPHVKCVRCWHHREDVGSHSEHPELCGRCVDNVVGSGETRLFV